MSKAAELRETGRTLEAEKLYRRILDRAPQEAEALHWLAVFRHMRGHNRSALKLLQQAVKLRPAPLYLYHLGEVQRALGRFAEAVGNYRQAARLAPAIADIRFGLGTALLELGQAAEAAEQLRLAIELAPSDAYAYNNLANALAELGDHDTAIPHYRRALQLQPRYAEASMNLGLALAERGRHEEAIAPLREAVDVDKSLKAAWVGLARCCLRVDRDDEALDAARTAARLHPESAEAHNLEGQSLFRRALAEDALDAYRAAIRLNPDYAEAHFNIGVCLQSLGCFDKAAEAHERAVALRPDLTEAHYNLALIGQHQAFEGRVATLRALLVDPTLADDKRSQAFFALGKMMEAQGDFDGAFEHYRRGNELTGRRRLFDPEQHVGFIDRLIATFDENFFAARDKLGARSEMPVFVLGMPRSGTSLAEQILSSHPEVHGAGELDDMRRYVRELPSHMGGDQPFPECARLLDGGLVQQLAREYLKTLRRIAPPAARRVVDKMPGNFLRLGLIVLLLPGARIIHCQRNPLDTCLSCYFHSFAHGLSFTYDLGHLGMVYRQYVRLMDHWRRVLPLRFYDLQYERLIADQEGESRRLIAFCGLSWDERCLEFHRRTRPVRTASFWQVRQPLYADSVNRWRSYARYLEPLFAALGDLVEPSTPASHS